MDGNLNTMANANEKWIDFDLGNPETHPQDGSEVLVKVASGLKGPATYRSKTGFALFNAPWMELGAVEQWHYGNWSILSRRTALPL
jgi:hypothetical protein